MINKCPQCKVSPIVGVTVKCRNDKCEIFNEDYYVYEWQKLEPVNGSFCMDKFNEIFQEV